MTVSLYSKNRPEISTLPHRFAQDFNSTKQKKALRYFVRSLTGFFSVLCDRSAFEKLLVTINYLQCSDCTQAETVSNVIQIHEKAQLRITGLHKKSATTQ